MDKPKSQEEARHEHFAEQARVTREHIAAALADIDEVLEVVEVPDDDGTDARGAAACLDQELYMGMHRGSEVWGS